MIYDLINSLPNRSQSSVCPLERLESGHLGKIKTVGTVLVAQTKLLLDGLDMGMECQPFAVRKTLQDLGLSPHHGRLRTYRIC